jgi:outer membrane protein assembly factor BamB
VRLYAVSLAAVLVLAAIAPASGQDASTYEVWKFGASAEIVVMSTIKDSSRDNVNDVIVAAKDRSVYLLDGVTGKRLWNFTDIEYHSWQVLLSSPDLDANGDGKSDALVSTADRIVVMLDGTSGAQLWRHQSTESYYRPGSACSVVVRSAHTVSDINSDTVPDIVVVAGSGDSCTKDRITAIAFNAKTGTKLWEFILGEDVYGLKDGIRGSSPVAVMDFTKDGKKDVAIMDDRGSLRVIDGVTGTEARNTKPGIFGAIWNLVEIPDISGDGQNDTVAFEFIDGEGGPDYARINAVDLIGSRIIWQVKLGDGLYNGAALYSAAWLFDVPAGGTKETYISVTQRIDDDLQLVLLDGRTGQEKWKFDLGEERSRDDLIKFYPVARITDQSSNGNDELAVGSIDSKLYLFDPATGGNIWTHAINGQINGIEFVPAPGGQKYIVVKDQYSGVRALSRLTTIETSISIGSSAKTVVESSRLVITGAVSPPFPGEVVQLRYVDPTGAVTTKPLILENDGRYVDIIEPEIIGDWKVSVEFKGEGFYLDSNSGQIGFTVIDETTTSSFPVKVRGEESGISYPVQYLVDGGQVTDMEIIKEQKTLSVSLAPSSSAGGRLWIELPRSVIDSWQGSYQVFKDGRAAGFEEVQADETNRALSIPFDGNTRQVQIIGTYIVPEFSAMAPLIMALTMVAAIAAVGIRSRIVRGR